MSGLPESVVVVGASAGGLAAAEGLRRGGFGGRITLVGSEPHLPYDRPPLSKEVLSGAWEPGRIALRSADDVAALNLDLRLGTTATGVDPDARTVTLDSGEEVGYGALVAAAGVSPRRLPGGRGHVLRTLEDALALRDRLRPGRRLAVVGAGFLGAEVAAVARGLGCEVTMVEPAPVPLAHAVGAEVGGVLTAVHTEQGVDLRTGVGVAEVEDGGLRLADGTAVEADDVLVAIGSVPNTGWLEAGGLPVEDGLVCDAYCEAVPGVYGVGDVARWHNPLFGVPMRVEHRLHAAEQGLAVARNILDPEGRKQFAPVPYFWSDQYHMKIQSYGYLRGHDEVRIVDGDLTERRFLAVYRTGRRLVGALGVGVTPRELRGWRKQIASGALWDDAVGGESAVAQADAAGQEIPKREAVGSDAR
ncbi:FAD-dependent oxidoreductase [Nocardiopsis dassonvillei]|uniref:NAD(P)/FAD-dependent oxidoreductase n=1 Tax=Nocardiopsis dassonvillei TaxID=2014 RepID=UPI0020106864|nr:FAD-dependent oxidoreductase [Nocardiopsis dassonvillei]MCK9873487.1 FAD-dependent oxidoreductase [Nocardiopsis dassonvillei]